MKYVNLWNQDDYVFSNNLEEILKLIETRGEFIVKNKWEHGSEITSLLEQRAKNQNVNINFTDETHQCVYLNDFNEYNADDVFIDGNFYNKYKNQIIAAAQIGIFERYIVRVTKDIFSDELIDKIVNCKNDNVYFYDVNLSEEQVNKLKNSYKNIYLNNDGKSIQISHRYLIGSNTISSINNDLDDRTVVFNHSLSSRELENLKLVSENKKLSISLDFKKEFNKTCYDNKYKNILIILKTLKKYNKNNKLEITIDDKDYFNQKYLKIFKEYPNLLINYDNNVFSIGEYVDFNNKLNKLIENIDDKLSPVEKYIKVYDLVKVFKKYKENPEDREQSRYLHQILDNEYMVCVGYASLLSALLNKFNIENVHLGVDLSDKSDLNKEEANHNAHARLAVYLKDEKYDIDNYYVSDPTWDNYLDADKYNYALGTFEGMRTHRLHFWLSEEDAYLDINSFEDFNKKMNWLINKEIRLNSVFTVDDFPLKKQHKAFESVINDILYTLSMLDNNLYMSLKKEFDSINLKFQEQLDINKYNCFSKEDAILKKIYSDSLGKYEILLTKLGNSVLNKTNKKMATTKLFQIISNVKPVEDINKYMGDFEKDQAHLFPYQDLESNIQR